MEADQDWMIKYSTEEARAKIEARKHLWSPELQERVTKSWNELIAEVESAIGESPSSERAQELVRRWQSLMTEFTNSDKDIEQTVKNVWSDRNNWPGEMQNKAPVIKPEVWNFIHRAREAGNDHN